MRVLIYEPRVGGHVLNYLRLLVPAVSELVDDVHVAIGGDAQQADEFAIHLRSVEQQVQWHPLQMPPMRGRLQLHRRRMQMLEAVLAKVEPQHVYVPTADGLSVLIGLQNWSGGSLWPPGVEAEGALHRGGFAYPLKGMRSAMQRLALAGHQRAGWTRLFHVDILAHDWIESKGHPLAEVSRWLPDPIERPTPVPRREARQKMQLPTEGRLLGTVGLIDVRKGIDLLLHAFRLADLEGDDRLLLVGRHSEQIRQLLKTQYADLVESGRVISVDRYVSVEELQLALAALDLVVTPHNHHIGISSIVLRAAAAQRPVVAADYGWSGYVVPKYQLGEVCEVRNRAALARQLGDSLQGAAAWQPTAASEQLLQQHDPSQFAAVWTDRLRERLGANSTIN